jgi:hypothetical protein
MATVEEPARKRTRVSRGPALLAAMIHGASLSEIAETEALKPEKVERLIRNELRKRWTAPAQDYARLQIARLEAIASQLKTKSQGGDLPAIDRLLKVLDRLDRYHGFTKLAALSSASREDVRPKLVAKLGSGSQSQGGGE